MLSKALTAEILAPKNFGFLPGMAYAFGLGSFTKWDDLLGDKELDLSQKQNNILTFISAIIYSIIFCHFSSVNNECLGGCLGLISGCLLGGKLDIYIHVVPSIVLPIFHAIVYRYFKNNSWTGLDYTVEGAKKLAVVYAHVFFVAASDEITHELFDTHPNKYISAFFDRRQLGNTYTFFLWLLSLKDLLPFGLSNVCDWHKMFFYPVAMGSGYEFMRSLKPAINKHLAV